MRVVDAGVLVGVLVGDLEPEALGDEELVAPHRIDGEVAHVLRRLAHEGDSTEALSAASLLTTEARLAAAPGIRGWWTSCN